MGLVEKVPYITAYSRTRQGEPYERVMLFKGIADTPVHVVTPKGNGLVFVMKEGGDRQEKPVPELEKRLVPA